MTGPQFQSQDINPNGYPFFTGNVAMSENYLWSTYGVADAGDDWNLAATPAYNGQTTAAFNADTFRILKDSKHPDEAFKVLTYLLGEGRRTCSRTYGGMPARPAEQDAFFETLQNQTGDDGKPLYPQKIDWNVAKEGVNHADVPNFESYMPAYNESLDLLNTFGTKWQATPGLDLDAEIEALKTQLQAIWDKAAADRCMTAPSVARPRRLSRRRSGLAWRRARWGYVFIAPWIIGFLLFTLIPMLATLGVHVHQHQPRPGGAAPLRRAAATTRPSSATSRPGIRSIVTFKYALLALPVAVALPFARRADAPVAPPRGLGRVPGAVLPALRRSRSSRACSSGAGCSRTNRAGSTTPCAPSASRTRRTGSRTRPGSTRVS